MKPRALIAAAAGLAILLSACGDSGTTTTVADSEPGDGFDIEIVAVDFEFQPDSWTVSTGTGLTVELANRGTLEHNWAVLNTVITDESELTEDRVTWEIHSESDTTATGVIDLPLAPGTYQIACTIQGHFSAGMVGELTVGG